MARQTRRKLEREAGAIRLVLEERRSINAFTKSVGIWVCLAAPMLGGCAQEYCSDRELETRAGKVCFEEAIEYHDYYLDDYNPSPLIADLDLDGDLDITFVLIRNENALLAVLINEGHRQFSVVELELAPDISRIGLAGLASGDFDLDGDPDLAAASPEAIWIVENAGDGKFSLRHTIEHAQVDLAAHDVVGDACPELVLVGATLDLASDLLSETPSVSTVAQLLAYTEFPTKVAIADVSGDSLVDIVVTPGPIIFWGTAEGITDVPFVAAEFGCVSDGDWIALDVDRDGTGDIACGHSVLLGGPQASWVDAQPVRVDPPGSVGPAGIMPAPHGDPSLVFVGVREPLADDVFEPCAELAVMLVDSAATQPLDDPRFGFVSFKRAARNIRNISKAVYADIDGDGHVDISDGANIQYGRSCR